jgi:hypothetical protein
MNGLIWWLVYQLPWQFQAVLVLIAAGAILWGIGMVFGWGVVRKIAAPVIGLAAVLVFWNKSKQEGYGQRVAEEKEALDKAEDLVAEKRTEIHALPDDELDRRSDRWIK